MHTNLCIGKVYNLTSLIESNPGVLVQPIIRFGGTDISHWFDINTKQPKTFVDPNTFITIPYTPYGRYLHIPPRLPTTDWDNSFGIPWWEDPIYLIGRLSKKMRIIRVVNTLTQQDDTVEVCTEDTLEEIRSRFLRYNAHAISYTWKRLGRPLNMTKTLEENGVADESEYFYELGIEDDAYIPAIHLYFNDDLTSL